MSDKASAVASSERGFRFDGVKWLLVLLLVVGSITAYNYYDQFSVAYRALGMVAAVFVALLVAAQTQKGYAFFRLCVDARSEIRRVVWPTKQETLQTTIGVVIITLIAGLLLWGLDSLLSWLISLIIG